MHELGTIYYVIDTVEKYRNVWRDRVQVEYVHDSVPYVQEVPVPVRTRNGYDRFTSWGFWLLLLLLLLAILLKLHWLLIFLCYLFRLI